MEIQAAILLVIVFFLMLAFSVPVSYSNDCFRVGNNRCIFDTWIWCVCFCAEDGQWN